MLTALRKFFGVVALVWLGSIALGIVACGIGVAVGTGKGSHSSPASIATSKTKKPGPASSKAKPAQSPADNSNTEPAEISGAMFGLSYVTSPIGILSCLLWFGLKLVRVSGHGGRERRLTRGGHTAAQHYMDYAKWFEQRSGQPVFTHGKHAGRALREVARRDPEYLRWMLSEDIPQETKKIVEDAIEEEQRPLEPRQVLNLNDRSSTPLDQVEIHHAARSAEVFTYEAPGIGLCPSCGDRPALFYCRPHQSALCLGCIGAHDSPSECSYIPAWRKEAAFRGSAQAGHAVYSYEAPGMPKCPQCKNRPALFYCCAHRLSVCLNCVGSHDVASECFYVPGWRATRPDDETATTDASGGIRGKPRPGDVFGIS